MRPRWQHSRDLDDAQSSSSRAAAARRHRSKAGCSGSDSVPRPSLALVWTAGWGCADDAVVRSHHGLVIACPHGAWLAIPLVGVDATERAARVAVLVKVASRSRVMRTVDHGALATRPATLTRAAGGTSVAGRTARSFCRDPRPGQVVGALKLADEIRRRVTRGVDALHALGSPGGHDHGRRRGGRNMPLGGESGIDRCVRRGRPENKAAKVQELQREGARWQWSANGGTTRGTSRKQRWAGRLARAPTWLSQSARGDSARR
ncbi:hypothetical protein FQA39_LY19312 [Lamprigera yunnana]|nr:hypothetical protein FQA39_LY19312 [Lamprigera yunnana]